jgi:hypothetical protein
MAKKTKDLLKFDQKLVLNQWLLSLFEVGSFEQLVEGDLKQSSSEYLTEDNITGFYQIMKSRRLFEYKELPWDMLLLYDQNIVRHTQTINHKRDENIRWKYFQYLSLLFTEIYLDRYFTNAQKLLADLNAFVEDFNKDKAAVNQVKPYAMTDLNKLSFWNATGSGKTLLMHINILQYRHYLKKSGKEHELNRTILLTPNEGLSNQHLGEFNESGFKTFLFDKNYSSKYMKWDAEIIDIHKLREESGDKTIAVDAFEGNNLVLVDEGHRGSSGTDWKQRRDKLCEHGFSFEYSATFGQAMRTSNNKELEQEYAKCILFDYSYKYFYKDGFGKEYRILNLAESNREETRQLYLTACLVAFYQQLKLYHDHHDELRPYQVDKPLCAFVGGTVTKGSSASHKQTVSDVVDILLFLSAYVSDRSRTVERIERLLSGATGLHDTHGNDIFKRAFTYLSVLKIKPDDIFDDSLRLLFNAPSQSLFHVENLKGSDGEIALRLGENDPFGVINVGDASGLCKLCENHPKEMVVMEQAFASSLFGNVNVTDSSINMVIGARKFTEGWNSWRVSTMGLMNIGRSEGSEIIQLFGRGVRLRGYNMTLKRSGFVSREDRQKHPAHLNIVETLNIFGVRADYMQQFREYLEEEGVPSNEEFVEISLPVLKNLGKKKLKVLDIKDGWDFKKDGTKPTLDTPDSHIKRHKVALNWYPKIQAQQSVAVKETTDVGELHEDHLQDYHLAFIDFDKLYFELQMFKNERSWHNLNLPKEKMRQILLSHDWYVLLIPKDELVFNHFDNVRRWQEIALALLKKYCDKFYKADKARQEHDHLGYMELTEYHQNFIQAYNIKVEQSRTEIIEKLRELEKAITEKKLEDFEWGRIHSVVFGQHLYQPLVYLKEDYVQMSPASLEPSERDFVVKLKAFYEVNKPYFKDRELYLLRNQSRGRGVGFFEDGGFYPDFILWLLVDGQQFINFVDPHGLGHSGKDDPKIHFSARIKKLESDLGDSSIKLNSFILSPTPFENLLWGVTKSELEAMNVFFQQDDGYVGHLLRRVTE